MKDVIKSISPAVLIVSALITSACAKQASEATNESSVLEFESWMFKNYGSSTGKVGHGIYIISDTEGDGESISPDDGSYIFVRYEVRNQKDSSITTYTDAESAMHKNEYDSTFAYAPAVLRMMKYSISQGIMDMIGGGTDSLTGRKYNPMRIGGSRTAIIPGWLTSTSSYYDTEAGYRANVTGSNTIYKINIVGRTEDIKQWQIDSIERYMNRHRLEKWDTAAHSGKGFYYCRDKAKEAERGVTVKGNVNLRKDTIIYINYTGRLLNGKVFDTTDENVAKDWGIYTEGKSYSPVQITCSSDSTKITMGSNSTSTIAGFSRIIWNMHPFESGIGLFDSDFGYGANGNGKAIPEYSPLMFEIDIVEKK